MLQLPLPAEITALDATATSERVRRVRAELAERVIILGHHYQRDEIVRWADYTGDSLKLSQLAAAHPEAPWIVFCGVHFMAETADILTTPEQTVILPNLNAGCSMADMAAAGQVEACWQTLGNWLDADGIVPVTYVNSTAAIKAFVGRHGGACCTSSNARQVLEWALGRGDRVLFLPDQHLGRNTAVDLGLNPEGEMAVWAPSLPDGGLTAADAQRARILLWKGHCSVHARFTVEQIEQARLTKPGCRVIVHPECLLAVVRAAGESGSTERIIDAVASSAPGTTWAIGTEINLVRRLAQQHPDKEIFCLDPVVCPCSTMYRIHPHYLLWVLEELAAQRVVNPIRVAPLVAADARVALQRMLSLSRPLPELALSR
ncbi:MAG: quinolinate synthase NadA [Armatimonadetes bacterium]|nr:quinolinate synthase NadA [Armatimonadota bacterium]MDE2206943.1 quinolinate synthase NadA [Armatimonadota bacterium]